MRMGENIVEAREDPEWRCPVCRDICNCSGANCLRAKRNLFPTQQLTHEALSFGWQARRRLVPIRSRSRCALRFLRRTFSFGVRVSPPTTPAVSIPTRRDAFRLRF
jgi:hypothetical protein